MRSLLLIYTLSSWKNSKLLSCISLLTGFMLLRNKRKIKRKIKTVDYYVIKMANHGNSLKVICGAQSEKCTCYGGKVLHHPSGGRFSFDFICVNGHHKMPKYILTSWNEVINLNCLWMFWFHEKKQYSFLHRRAWALSRTSNTSVARTNSMRHTFG